MKRNFTIKLENLEFFAYHGLYPDEKINGNTFLVNIKIEYVAIVQEKVNLENAIDYVSVYEVVSEIMNNPTELLENLCYDLVHSIKKRFSSIKTIQAEVSKLNPPIGGKCEKTTVIYKEPNKKIN